MKIPTQPWVKLPMLPDYEDTFIIYIVLPGTKRPIRYAARFELTPFVGFYDLRTGEWLEPISWTLCPQVG